MKFLDKFKSKSRANLKERRMAEKASRQAPLPSYNSYTRPGTNYTPAIPPAIIERIFGFVCPHTTDESYASAELASPEDGCTLCDIRNLARCMMVDRRWYRLAGNVLWVELEAAFESHFH